MKLSNGLYRNTKSSEMFLNGLSSIDRVRVITGGQVTTDNIYNGNISWMVTDLAKIGDVNNNRTKSMQAMLYQYDQLHRIVQSKSLATYAASTGFAPRSGSASPYDEDYTYDPNGNILTLQRHNETGGLADDFHYQYYANTNKLREVKPLDRDKVITGGQVTTDNILYRNLTLKGNAYTTSGKFVDIKALENVIMDPDFDAREGSDAWMHIVEDDGTYQYDAIGNLIKDQDEGVHITWTPYGKVREVHTKGDSLVVDFRYDASGNRISKSVTIRKDTLHYTTSVTRYLRDAGGNVMAIYKDSTLSEQPIYGSSRLGQYKGTIINGSLTLGERKYELSNHLGNVLSVITDNINMQWDSAWATVASTSDYYPFGLEMKGRVYNDTTSYRYGFNGKEKEDNGEFGSTHYDYGDRLYNPTIGRWIATDKLSNAYPFASPYIFALNTPIQAKDPDGNLVIFINGYWGFGTGAHSGGNKNYWSYSNLKGGWADDAMEIIQDRHARYYDGAKGGLWKEVRNIFNPFRNAIDPSLRFKWGYTQGMKDAKEIIDNLQRDPNTGKIIESIKFVNNSMGTSYQRGFSQALTDYVADYNGKRKMIGDSYNDPKIEIKIEFVVDLAAFQGEKIPADPNAERSYFMRSKKDPVAGYESAKVPGAQEIGVDSSGEPKSQGHHASNFPAEDLPQTNYYTKNGSSTTEENPEIK